MGERLTSACKLDYRRSCSGNPQSSCGGVAGNIYKVVSALAPILQTIWSIIKPIVQFIGFSVISIIEGLTDTITKLGDAISFVLNLISKIGSGIGSGISSLVGALGAD